MKNKEITIYELLGLIKKGKAPKKIKYYDEIYTYIEEEKMYYDKNDNSLWKYYNGNILNDTVEILLEEYDEWEDIEELEIYTSNYIYDKEDIHINREAINQLIKNQKYLKERLDSKDES